MAAMCGVAKLLPVQRSVMPPSHATSRSRPRPKNSTGGEGANEKADDETKDSTYSFDDVSGDISRVTLRMMEQIKARAEEAANQNGVSLNSWVSQAVQGALRDQMRKNGMA